MYTPPTLFWVISDPHLQSVFSGRCKLQPDVLGTEWQLRTRRIWIGSKTLPLRSTIGAQHCANNYDILRDNLPQGCLISAILFYLDRGHPIHSNDARFISIHPFPRKKIIREFRLLWLRCHFYFPAYCKIVAQNLKSALNQQFFLTLLIYKPCHLCEVEAYV